MFVIFAAMLGCGIFAYAVNKIGVIINDMDKKDQEFRHKMAVLSAHMKRRGLTKQLQLKVKKYYEYM